MNSSTGSRQLSDRTYKNSLTRRVLLPVRLFFDAYSRFSSVSPDPVRRRIFVHTSARYFRSWETLMIAPGKSESILRITGPDSGEKFRVGSSRTSTLAPEVFIRRRKIFACWPPESSRMGRSISSAVKRRAASQFFTFFFSSGSPVRQIVSTAVESGSR